MWEEDDMDLYIIVTFAKIIQSTMIINLNQNTLVERFSEKHENI